MSQTMREIMVAELRAETYAEIVTEQLGSLRRRAAREEWSAAELTFALGAAQGMLLEQYQRIALPAIEAAVDRALAVRIALH